MDKLLFSLYSLFSFFFFQRVRRKSLIDTLLSKPLPRFEQQPRDDKPSPAEALQIRKSSASSEIYEPGAQVTGEEFEYPGEDPMQFLNDYDSDTSGEATAF